MQIEHVNRKGQKYYLHAGKTKTGKPRFWFALKKPLEPVEKVPDGFEIYEEPGVAQVMLRKVVASSIRPEERQILESALQQHLRANQFLIDTQGDSLVIYLADNGPAESQAISRIFGSTGGFFGNMAESLIGANSQFTKMMRFTLVDEKSRRFWVERWCFRGSIDDWFPLGDGTLPKMAAKYVKHLGKESFFDLM